MTEHLADALARYWGLGTFVLGIIVQAVLTWARVRELEHRHRNNAESIVDLHRRITATREDVARIKGRLSMNGRS